MCSIPSIIPGYIYTLFATVIVGALIIATCGFSITGVKAKAENQQISNIENYVAAKSVELIAHSTIDNLKSKLTLDVPNSVGNQRYWIQLFNDSSNAWVGAGLGIDALPNDSQENIPSNVVASGTYVSGSGPAFLQYQVNSTGAYLTIYGGS